MTTKQGLTLRVPGDKSITQRSLILGAIASGRSRLNGLLAGADPRSTARALATLGAQFDELDWAAGSASITGKGLRGLRGADAPLDFDNSGTGARLMMGVLAAHEGCVTLTGDASLRSRPMERIASPLRQMGAAFRYLDREDRFPLQVCGGALRPIRYESPVASAQIKSATLLAGLCGGVWVQVSEPHPSRDHTERMFAGVGVALIQHEHEGRWLVEMRDPPDRISPLEMTIPGDISSAAYLLGRCALAGRNAEGVEVQNVGLNPTRDGFLDVLQRMGAIVERRDVRDQGGEVVGTLSVTADGLTAVDLGGDEIPRLIDEIPMIAVLAARAEGVTRISGAEELRVKETDRITATVDNLRRIGVEAEERPGGMVVKGRGGPLSGRIETFHDHRIAMAFGVLGAEPGNEIIVEDPSVSEVSYPGFWETLRELSDYLGSNDRPAGGASLRPPTRRGVVITIDGPAGAGKSTTAKAVAERLGYRHLDSGALYRGVTWAINKKQGEAGVLKELSRKEIDSLGLSVDWSPEGIHIVQHGQRVPDSELRSPQVTARVSEVAAWPGVRSWLLQIQRDAGNVGGLVADGRDMGTVVFPQAEVKVFLEANVEERARRRLGDKGLATPTEEDLSDEALRLSTRDTLDSEREVAPLRAAEDAVHLDTSELAFDEQVQRVIDLVAAKR